MGSLKGDVLAEAVIQKFKDACKAIGGELETRRGWLVCEATEEVVLKVRPETLEAKVTDEGYGLQRWDYLENVILRTDILFPRVEPAARAATYYPTRPQRKYNTFELEFKEAPGFAISMPASGIGPGFVVPGAIETPVEKLELKAISSEFKDKYLKKLTSMPRKRRRR